MKKKLMLLTFFIITTFAYGQNLSPEYFAFIKNAEALYKDKDYKNSAQEFSKAFITNGWKGRILDRYNAACSWALAGVKDSAFYNLYRIASSGAYKNYDHIIQDADLVSIYEDRRWKPLLELVKQNKEKAEANTEEKNK